MCPVSTMKGEGAKQRAIALRGWAGACQPQRVTIIIDKSIYLSGQLHITLTSPHCPTVPLSHRPPPPPSRWWRVGVVWGGRGWYGEK